MNTVVIGRRTVSIVFDQTDIQGLSSQNPCVVTWTSHGLSTGDRVSFKGITQTGWTALNGNSYPVTVINANSFSIPFDASGLAAYDSGTDPGLIGSDYIAPWPMRLSAIDFHPSAVNDRLVVREESGSGPVIYKRTDTTGGGIHQSVGGDYLSRRIYIKSADLTLSNPANALVILEFN